MTKFGAGNKHLTQIPVELGEIRAGAVLWDVPLRQTLADPRSYRGRLRLKCDGTRAEIRFRLSPKRTSPFKSAGVSVQSTADSRGVHICGSNAGYTMFRGSVKSTGYPLHSPVSPSLALPASPCAITFQLDSNPGYNMFRGSVKSTGYPLHSPVSPSLPLPYVTLCHHISTGLYEGLCPVITLVPSCSRLIPR
jgi:hypothetical protein